MEQLELAAERRSIIGKRVSQLRREGFIPAILYGHRTAPIPLKIKERELRHALAQTGGHQLISLRIEGDNTPRKALAHEVQRDVITGALLHIDLYQVIMTEKLTAEIPLVFVGEAPALTTGERAILLEGLNRVRAECLPDDLIQSIEVDVGGLEKIGQAIYVKDLKVPSGIEVLTDEEKVVAEIVRAAPIEEEVEEVEVVEEVIPEEEEKAEEGEPAGPTLTWLHPDERHG